MNIKVDLSQLKKYRMVLGNTKVEKHIEGALKETVMLALRETKKRTPVVTGTLRREWKTTPVKKVGNAFTADLYNDTKYAPYVEYGHRTRGGRGWVEGQYMMTNGVKQAESVIPRIAKKHLEALKREMKA